MRVIRTLAWIALAAPAVAVGDFEVEPRTVPWRALDEGPFDRSWILPEAPSRQRLLEAMRELSVLEYMEDDRPRRFGDLVAEAQAVAPTERAAWLAERKRRVPRLVPRWGEALSQLLLDDHLFSDDWAPDEDHPRDGILMLEAWSPEDPGGVWSDVTKAPRFERGATLYHADLETIKAVENDYRLYPDNVGASYEEIYPVAGSHLIGDDPAGEPFRALRIRFESDLPFPFSSYECDLRILDRMQDGRLYSDIYSTSPDFYYMAGQDVFLPVSTSGDKIVAYLVVRDFGFDLKSVPDGPQHRGEALRSTLGNMKRNSEARFRRDEDSFAPPAEILGNVRVRGRR